MGLIPNDSRKLGMFATSQEASFTHSASNTGLFVKHLLAVRVNENLNRLEVYPYLYVVTDKYQFTAYQGFLMSVTLEFM